MSTCPIIAIDPGNTQSGYCVIDRSTLRPLEFGKIDNAELLDELETAGVIDFYDGRYYLAKADSEEE